MGKTKIIRTGNSAAVILPAAVLASKNIKVGDEVVIEELATDLVLRIPGRRSVMKAGERVLRDHGEVLRKLAAR